LLDVMDLQTEISDPLWNWFLRIEQEVSRFREVDSSVGDVKVECYDDPYCTFSKNCPYHCGRCIFGTERYLYNYIYYII